MDQRFAMASKYLCRGQKCVEYFGKASSTITPFSNENNAAGGLQAVEDNTKDDAYGMEGIISNDDLVSGVGTFGLMSTQVNLGQSPTRTSHLDVVSQYAGLVGARSTEAMDVDIHWPIDVRAPTEINTVLPRRSLSSSDWAWNMSPEYGAHIQRNGDDRIANMMEHMDLQPVFESPTLTTAPPQSPCSSGLPSISPDLIMNRLQVNAIAADGTIFDTTIPSVENLLTCLLLVRCSSISFDAIEFFRQPRFEIPIDQDRLMIEIEDLLCWIVGSCQRAVAEEQIAKEIFDGHALLSIPVHQRNTRDLLFPVNRTATRGETLIEALKLKALKMLTIELSVAGSGRYPVESDVVTVCSIPNNPRRTSGLMVSFAFNTPAFAARISPQIKNFNVVPVGSSIIRCVTKNDLEGMQKLFAEGQASPLDVDPKGNSLLQVSETHSSGNAHVDSSLSTPCSEVTLLHSDSFSVVELVSKLLDSVQHCAHPALCQANYVDSSDYKADFVWMLWTHYVNYIRIPGASRIGPNRIEDFDKCARMTDAVLESGYDLDQGLFYHPSRPNLLFELACDGGHGWQKRSNIVKALQYLVRKGYDLEEKNCEGDTPLLYATKAHRPGAVTHIEAFVEAGSDANATNLAGQGPLHCALGVPETVLPADWNVQEHDTFSIPSPSFYEYRITYLTFHDGPEGYNYHPEHICWLDTNGVSQRMRNPIQMLKERSKYKILVLLEAGCDPNLPDIAGETPHQYAERNGLFPQWKWALIKSGYMLNEKSGQWVK